MSLLTDGTGNARWDSQLVKDLAFIKTHLRYPFNKKTISVTIVGALLISLVLRLLFLVLTLKGPGNHSGKWAPIILAVVILISLPVSIWRYLQTLRFVTVHTRFLVLENMSLIKRFLEHEHLVVFRHPDAPEVFQISSRPLNLKGDQREIMIFIADDHRILVNSHFSNPGIFAFQQSRNYKVMAERLKRWVETHLNEPDSAVTVRDF